MTWLAVVVVVLNAVALLLVPRRWALLPFLAVACYVPIYLGVEIGSFNFTALRILIAVGLLRLVLRGEGPPGPMNGIDGAMLSWALWLLASRLFHDDPSAGIKFRFGLVFDAMGIYFLVRCYCRSAEDIRTVLRIAAIVLVPLAAAMLYENITATNPFAVLGGVDESSQIREGHVRAQGPFGHPILAGTVGAVCLPLMLGLWRVRRKTALTGVVACLTIVFSAASSGPILSAVAGFFALWIWRHRKRVRLLQCLAVLVYVALDMVMKAPAYFLVARIDLAGGSTSWYRARLIESAFEHLSEWWFSGTNYTRDWMPVAVPWSPSHTDITSHYIQMGVWGGMPLLLLFLLVLLKAFRRITRSLKTNTLSPTSQYELWAMGSSLFAFAVTGLSVSFFDQSIAFLYLTLGTIASTWSAAISSLPKQLDAPRAGEFGTTSLSVPRYIT